jgi:hypothetical protein
LRPAPLRKLGSSQTAKVIGPIGEKNELTHYRALSNRQSRRERPIMRLLFSLAWLRLAAS